jgi:DNA-binding NarL/FixJ family response regulator
MEPTYVWSTRRSATVAHLRREQDTLCGQFIRWFATGSSLPSGRRLCKSCRQRREPTWDTAQRRLNQQAREDAFLVALLSQGLTVQAIRRRTRWGQRTVQRRLREAMHRAGAKSYFQWGLITGRGAVTPGDCDGQQTLL